MHEFKKLILAFGLVFCLAQISNPVYAQVCPMITSSSSSPDCSAGCNVCPGDNITFSVTGDDLPDGGTIDWYSSTTPGFNPYLAQGTMIGSSTISTGSPPPCTDCPEILAIMVDACATPEGANEFMIISSGSGFTVSDLSLDFAAQNNSGGPASDDINVGATCNWQAGNPSLITGCSNVIPAGPGTFIPAGSTVVVQTSSAGTQVYDFSGTCGITDCIYVISNSCARGSFGAFTNCNGTGIRDYTIFLNSCACSSTATYSTDDPAIDCPGGAGPTADGTYYIPGGGFGNDGCPNAPAAAASPSTSNASTISNFVYSPTASDCTGSPLYIVGISNPAPSNCCSDVFTEYFELNVSCPMANTGVSISACDIGNGTANFDLTSVDAMVSGGTGTVNWYTDAAGTLLIGTPTNYNSANGGTVYATVLQGCESTPEPVTLNVISGPVATAGSPIEICGAQPVMLTGSIVPSAGGGTWMSSGDGTFANANSAVTTYTPGAGDIATGSVLLTLMANPGGGCPGTSSSLTVTINTPASANAGGPYNICSGQTAPLMGSFGGSGISGTWTTLGDGGFDNPNNINAVYTPGIGDIGLGMASLQFEVISSIPSCPSVIVMTTVTIAQGASASIQGDTEICAAVNANLTVITGGPAGSINWNNGSGDGTFSNPTGGVTNYSPGPGDIALGFVMIAVDVASTNGCPAGTDMILLTINQGDVINTMAPTSICGGDDIFLSLSSSGPFGSVLWSTSSGDGSFSNPANSATTYTPGPSDILAGNVQIQVSSLNAPCTNYQDAVSIDIVPTPVFALTANPTALCGPGDINLEAIADNANTGGVLWSSSGDGSFDITTILTPTYTVGSTDISNGTVTLYAQGSSVDPNCTSGLDSLIITIGSGPTVSINANPIGCNDQPISLDATMGNGATMVTWSTAGDGTFDDINALSPNYTPGLNDQTNGSVMISIITDSPNANCPAATAMILVTINAIPTISLSGSNMACGNELIAVTSLSSANAGTISWSTSGDGTFSVATGAASDYTIGNTDVANGTVTIYGTTEDPIGPCIPGIDSIVIAISSEVTAGTANASTVVCADAMNTINLFNELTLADSGGIWVETSGTSSTGSGFNAGAGTFNVTGQAVNIYTFEYTVTAVSPCLNDSEIVTVEVIAAPVATVTNSAQICDESTQGSIVNLDALVTAGDQTGSWADTDGTLVNLTNTASVDFDGITPGNYTFTYTTNSAVSPCNEVNYTTIITVENCACPSPATAPIADLCNDAGNIDLSTFVVTPQPGSWAITGALPAGSNPATIVGDQFMGDGSDAGTYTLTFTLDAAPLANCPDSSVQTIVLNPVVNAGVAAAPLNICNDQGTIVNLFDQLTGENSGGNWTETSATPSTGTAFDPSGNFNTTGQPGGTYTFEYLMTGVAPCVDDSEVVTVILFAVPTATVTPTALICNTTSNGSIINFDDLVTAGDLGGSWADTDVAGVNLTNTASVDFDGITPGVYTFTYTTNSATAPCNEAMFTTIITVENCVCPSPATAPIPAICNDAANIDLSTFVLTAQPGSWALSNPPAGSNPAILAGSNLMVTGSDPGLYTLTFTLDAAPLANCPDSSVQTVMVNPILNAGNQAVPLVLCEDDPQLVNLFDQLVGEDAGGNWIETSASPSTGGAFDPTGNFNTTSQLAGVYSFSYLLTGLAPCPSVSAEVFIEIIAAPTATVTTTALTCNATADGSIVNFDLLVTAGDQTGTWVDTDGSGVILTNTTNVDFDGITAGNYTFTYTTNSAIAPCTENNYTTIVTVENCLCPSPQTLPLADLCDGSAILILDGFVQTSEPGTWTITDPPIGINPATISGSVFDGNNADPGVYELTFTLDAAPLAGCPDSSVQTLELFSPPNSGTVTFSFSGCNNDPIPVDLSQFLFGADATGIWTETSAVPSTGGAFDPISGTFNSLNQLGGIYNFTYTVAANGPCLASSTEYTVVIEAGASATVSPTALICNDATNGSLINFNSLITAGDNSGNWVDTDVSGVNLTDLTNVDFDGILPGNYLFTYTVGATSQFCSPVSYTTTVTVENCLCPSPNTLAIPSFCESSADVNLFDYNFPGQLGIWSLTNQPVGSTAPIISGGNLINIGGGDPGIYELTFTLNAAPIVGCPDSSVVNFEILSVPETDYIATLCTGDSIVVNGTTYDFNLQDGMEIITGGAQNGCDSIVNIDLTFDMIITLPSIVDTLCVGDSLVVNQQVFNENNLFGTVSFNTSGCDSVQQVTISYFAPVISNLDTTLCTGENIIINGITFDEITTNGTVIFMNGAQNGCDSTLNVTVNFEQSITGAIVADNSICLGDSTAIEFNFSSGNLFDITYTLNGLPVTISSVSNGHIETIYLDNNTDIGILNVNALGISCPVDSPLNSIPVEIFDLVPNAQIITDYNGFATSCNGSADAEVMIDVIGGTGPYDFQWANQIPDLNNLSAGTYAATVNDANGCLDSLNFVIDEPDPTDFSFSVNNIACPGEFTGSILVENILGPGSNYFYSLDNINFTPIASLPLLIDGLGTGPVNLIIEDENNCGAEANTSIAVVNNLFIDPIPDQTIQQGDSVQLTTSTNFTISTISWSPAESLSCFDCIDPIAAPDKTTIYTVTITDTSGCEVVTMVELKVDKARVYTPNVFSPNDDGLNDEFYIQTPNDNIIIEQMIIVDRWGEIVFKASNIAPNDASLGWNGTLKGEKLNPAVFVYYIQLLYPDGTMVPVKGDVTLMR